MLDIKHWGNLYEKQNFIGLHMVWRFVYRIYLDLKFFALLFHYCFIILSTIYEKMLTSRTSSMHVFMSDRWCAIVDGLIYLTGG